MEKLGQLRAEADREGTWDLVVVDTPPSRSALDFLDAPARLGSFLDGRFIKLLLAPAKVGGRAYLKVLSSSVNNVTNTLTKVLGGQVLRDIQTFVAALDTMFGGFRERATATYALLRSPGTAFVVVAAPEPDALREAAYFVERLSADQMPLAGLVVNRVTEPPAAELDAADSTAGADKLAGSPAPAERAVAGLLRLHAEHMLTAQREKRLQRRFSAVHPKVPKARVGALGSDVHDVAGLRLIGELLAKQD